MFLILIGVFLTVVQSVQKSNALEITPSYASVLGGRMLDISGNLSIPEHANIRCKFGSSKTVEKPALRVNSTHARCPVPRLTQRGQTRISFCVHGKCLNSTITIALMGRYPYKVKLEKGKKGQQWTDINPSRLTITWDPSVISSNNTVSVYVKLIGYRETENEPEWRELRTLGRVRNSGTFSFSPSQHRCSGDRCNFDIGAIEVGLRKKDWEYSNTHIALTSGIKPIGWFISDYMKFQYGSNWPDDRCNKWHDEDKKDNSWLENLLPCPTTMQQAISDFGRWQQDDACNNYSNSETNCNLHKPSVHCARSFKPTSKGAGNQCCYGPDSSLLGNKSTPDRSHDWGASPYNKPGYVPSASHWIRDIIPVYFCMKWSNNTRKYLDLRPPKVTPPYRSPKLASVSSIVKTFDGLEYNLDEEDDVWLYKSESILIQGRFKKLNEEAVLTAVAVKGKHSQTVEIHLSPPNLSTPHRLLVYVDDEVKFFDEEPLTMQDFRGVTVITEEPKTSLDRHGIFIMIFSSEVGVRIDANRYPPKLDVNFPPEFKNTGNFHGGLLGSWNDNKEDDRKVNSGEHPWAVGEEEKLFRKSVSVDLAALKSRYSSASVKVDIMLLPCLALALFSWLYVSENVQ